jgi:hypothetical protein
VETSESAYCASSIERIQRVLDRDVAGLPGPGKSVAAFFLSTIQRKGGIADQYTDRAKKPAWNGRRFSALVQAPAKMDLWAEYESKRRADPTDANAYYIAHREDMDKGASVLWEHRFNPDTETSALQAIQNYRADYGEASFLTELQNDPPEETAVVADTLSTKNVTSKTVSVPRGVLPNASTRVTVGLDIGKHLIHGVVCAHDRQGGCHICDYFVRDVPAFPDVGYSIKKALASFREEILLPGWRDESGNVRAADLTLIDSGYQPDAIYSWCRECGFLRHKPAKGHSNAGMEKAGTRLSRYFVPKDTTGGVIAGNGWYINKVNANSILLHHDADVAKEAVADRWRMEPGAPGGFSLFDAPWQQHIRFASHQTSERLTDDFTPGKGLSRKWVKHSRSNHFLDALVLCLVGSNVLGPSAPEPEPNPERTADTPAPVAPRSPPRLHIRPVRVRYLGGAKPLPF